MLILKSAHAIRCFRNEPFVVLFAKDVMLICLLITNPPQTFRQRFTSLPQDHFGTKRRLLKKRDC